MEIAIIGSGGAGMTAAWLLDGRHQVTVYERNAILGGHAHTTAVPWEGRQIYADDGFGWFSDVLYPTLMRLLETLGVPTRIVPMSLSFTQEARGRTLAMPPLGVGQLFSSLFKPADIWDMLRLDRAIRRAGPVVHQGQRALSWETFLSQQGFAPDFVQEVLTPVVAGCWGGPYGRAGEFSAYTLMKYLVFHRPSALARYRWHVMKEGANAHIRSINAGLTTGKTLVNTGVVRLEPAASGWRILDSQGGDRVFQQVVICAGAPDARKLLPELASLEATRQALSGFEYYTVRLATHSDVSFMPARRADWRVANLRWDGKQPALTVWSDAAGGAPVFTSYIYQREPRPCHHVSTFNLPLMTTRHVAAQRNLEAVQGVAGLHFAGDWTRDIGSHEDAVVSALEACRRLDPDNPRIALLSTPRQYPPMKALPAASSPLSAAQS